MQPTAADDARPRSRPDADLLRDARALHRALGELIRVHQFRDRDRICCHGLSVSQCYALDAVARGRARTVNALSADLYLDKSTVSRVVRGLEEKGFVRRRAHPGDGRAVFLEATAAGLDVLALIEEDAVAQEAAILAEFDEEVRREIPRLVSALARVAGGQVETAGGCCRMR